MSVSKTCSCAWSYDVGAASTFALDIRRSCTDHLGIRTTDEDVAQRAGAQFIARQRICYASLDQQALPFAVHAAFRKGAHVRFPEAGRSKIRRKSLERSE